MSCLITDKRHPCGAVNWKLFYHYSELRITEYVQNDQQYLCLLLPQERFARFALKGLNPKWIEIQNGSKSKTLGWPRTIAAAEVGVSASSQKSNDEKVAWFLRYICAMQTLGKLFSASPDAVSLTSLTILCFQKATSNTVSCRLQNSKLWLDKNVLIKVYFIICMWLRDQQQKLQVFHCKLLLTLLIVQCMYSLAKL